MALRPGKIAICISGLVRTGIPAYPSFDGFFGDLDADVFIHTWTTDYTPDVNRLYAPVSARVESPLDGDQGSFGNMLYGIMMANRLKRQHEVENNFRYSLVIKTRFDLIFPDTKFSISEQQPRTITASGGNCGINPTDYEHHGISDVLFWGDSQSMDIASDTYMYYRHHCLPKYNRMKAGEAFDPENIFMSPGTLIMNQCIKNNIHVVKGNVYGEIPYRTDVGHLDPRLDYNKIRERYNRG